VLALCSDASVMRSSMAPGAPITRVVRVDPALGAPIQIGPVQGPEDPVFIHTSAGDVLVYDLRDGTLIRQFEARDAPWRVITALGDRVVMRDQPGSARVFDWRTGRQVAVVPGVQGETGDAALLGGGDRLRLACSGVEDWELPAQNPPPMRWSTPSGIAGVAVSPDGSMFASAHGDGHLRVGRMDSTEWVVDLHLTPGVVKDVAFSPDGRRVAAALTGVQQLAWVDLAAPDVAHLLPSEGCSRVVWLRSGLYGASYEPGLLWWADPSTGPPVRIGDAQVLDLDAAPEGGGAVVAVRGSGLSQLVEAPTPHLVPLVPGAEAAITAGGRGLVVWRGDHGIRIARDGEAVVTIADRGAHVISLQISPDGRWLATGDTNGRLELWSLSPVALRASWRGHDHRVTALAFDPTGRWLISGSWDWDVARWSLDPLDTDPALLLTALHAAWGRTAEEVLHAR
jgi:WD40 repeat protein